LLSATDGLSGFDVAREQLPDLILMDINLPGLSGIDTLHMLRADVKTARIPAIALSANAMPQDIDKGMNAGFCRYLTKPIRIDEFMACVEQTLQATAGLD